MLPTVLWGSSERTENFRITRDHSEVVEGIKGNVCQDFLKVVNQVPRDELKACMTLDFTDTPFSYAKFTPVPDDRLMAYFKRLYNRPLDTEAYTKHKAERLEEYKSGYITLSEAFIDLDGDGKKEHVVEEKRPTINCIPSEYGPSREVRKQREIYWEGLSKQEQFQDANKHGFKNYYKVLKEGEGYEYQGLIDHIIKYEHRYFSYRANKLDYMNMEENWNGRDWLSVFSIFWDSQKEDASVSKRCWYWVR